MWFLQAIPKLRECIVIPESRSLELRLRSLFDLDDLPRDKAASSQQPRDISKENTYLGHDPKNPPQPVRGFLRQKIEPEKTDARMAFRHEI